MTITTGIPVSAAVSALDRACPDVPVKRTPAGYAVFVPWEAATTATAALADAGLGVHSVSQEEARIDGAGERFVLDTNSPLRQGLILLANEVLAVDALLPGGLRAVTCVAGSLPEHLSGRPELAFGPWFSRMPVYQSLTGRVAAAWAASPFGHAHAPISAQADVLATLVLDELGPVEHEAFSWTTIRDAARHVELNLGMLETARLLADSPSPAALGVCPPARRDPGARSRS